MPDSGNHVTETFFCLPEESRDPERSRYRFLPIPYEGTVCFLDGTARGPQAILGVSDQMEHFDEELLVDLTSHGIVTLPPVPAAETPEEEMKRIEDALERHDLFRPDRFPIVLGGEHSITPPIVRAAARRYEDLSVLQFDAHADLRDSFTGGRFSHASAMRRVLESTDRLVQVGIRSFSREEYQECPGQIRKRITPAMIRQDYSYCLDRILYSLTENVYITIDIDVFDPSFAPGTGTPEPGGLSWREVTGVLKQVFVGKNVVGADIVEVSPLGGRNVITEFLAARLAGKLIAYDMVTKAL